MHSTLLVAAAAACLYFPAPASAQAFACQTRAQFLEGLDAIKAVCCSPGTGGAECDENALPMRNTVSRSCALMVERVAGGCEDADGFLASAPPWFALIKDALAKAQQRCAPMAVGGSSAESLVLYPDLHGAKSCTSTSTASWGTGTGSGR